MNPETALCWSIALIIICILICGMVSDIYKGKTELNEVVVSQWISKNRGRIDIYQGDKKFKLVNVGFRDDSVILEVE